MDLKDILFCQILIYLLASYININALTPAPKLFKVWGPGLQPHKIVMPARYFFIQTVDHNNNSIKFSLEHHLQVVIDGMSKKNKPCRIWTNILDRKNGVYIIRYKVYEECSHFQINIKYQNDSVGKSPYILHENIYPDSCYCPKTSLQEILLTWECKNILPQILNDFKSFGNLNWDILRPKVVKEFNKPQSVSLCHYVIKNNEVYRKCYGQYVGFNMFSDSILLSLTRKALIPDVEFFINLGDWPLSTITMKNNYPIFSWCGSKDTNDIVMPTYELTESSLENMGRVMLDMLSVQGNVKDIWEKRVPKLFWRGRDSNRQRLNLISLSKQYPDLINASLTNFFFFKSEEELYGPKSEHISFFKFFDYKYQLSIDGTVAAYRMPFLLGGGSLVFKTDSRYYEHFYANLIPNVHYVPVKSDLSDLIEKINWARQNNDEAYKIAQSGQQFANDYLLPKDILCYYMQLLNELNKVTISDVNVLDGMIIVNQKNSNACDCLMTSNNEKDEL